MTMANNKFLPFPCERFLNDRLPNYEDEWNDMATRSIVATVLFIVVIPLCARTIIAKSGRKLNTTDTNTTSIPLSKSSAASMHDKSRGRKEKNSRTTRKKSNGCSSSTAINDEPNDGDEGKQASTNEQSEAPRLKVPAYFFPTMNLCFFVYLFTILIESPNNNFAARRVFLAPLLKPDECTRIISMAKRAARQNVLNALISGGNDDKGKEKNKRELELLLKQPEGWRKDRHTSYPTTDLNIVLDPFTDEDRNFMRDILDARLSPLIERVYGISRDSIRANDMFIVRYDTDYGQSALKRHTDSSHISFNILLNDEFEGGGTRFHNRLDSSYYDAKPKPGQVLLNNGMINHEGLPTVAGTRYIFVGFMSVDRSDPMTGKATNLSLFSSFLSFPWLTVFLKEGLYVKISKDNDKAIREIEEREIDDDDDDDDDQLRSKRSGGKHWVDSFLFDCIHYFTTFGDVYAPHGLMSLVDEVNENKYIDFLDRIHHEIGDRIEQSRWFSGQQIDVGLDGNLGVKWESRADTGENSFEDL